MLHKIYDRLGVLRTIIVLTSASILISVSGTFLILYFFDSARGWRLGLTIATVLPLIIAPLMSSIPLRLLVQLDHAQQEKAQLVVELQETLANVKTLKGLIPICASCKKMHGDEGYWQQLEDYIHINSEATLSHGYCPECAQDMQTEIDILRKAKSENAENSL